MRTIAHQHQHGVRAVGRGDHLEHLVEVLLLRQARDGDQHPLPLVDAEALAQGAGVLELLRAAGGAELVQIQARGHHVQGTIHAVAVQQAGHLRGGHDHRVSGGERTAGEGLHHLPAHRAARGVVVRVVLVDGVVRVHQRHGQGAGDAPRPHIGGELGLGVHHIRAPAEDVLEHPPARGHADAGTLVDQRGRDRADAVHPGLVMRADPLGQGEHPHIAAQGDQLAAQGLDGGDHSVDHGLPPVGGDQHAQRAALLIRAPGAEAVHLDVHALSLPLRR